MSANLFVGSTTKRSMMDWVKVFKIADETEDDESDFSENFEKLENILEKENLKFCIDYIYQEEYFYIGRIVKNVREDIYSDIAFWEKYNITDVDIFAAMYSLTVGLEYSLDV